MDHLPRHANSRDGELLELALVENDATKSARKVLNSTRLNYCTCSNIESYLPSFDLK